LKKLFAILLIAGFSVQITGYHLLFYFRQADIKKSVKKRLHHNLDRENTEEFVFSLAGKKGSDMPEWEGNDEFRLNGEMYDVIEKKIENGKLFVRCISDKKETELINRYKDITKDDFGGLSKKRASLLLTLSSIFYAPVSISGYDIWSYPKQNNWFSYKCPLSFHTIEVLTPPPQFV